MIGIVLQEGLCHICQISQSLTLTKAKIMKQFPNKNNFKYEDSKNKFYHQIYDNIVRLVDFNLVKVLIIGR